MACYLPSDESHLLLLPRAGNMTGARWPKANARSSRNIHACAHAKIAHRARPRFHPTFHLIEARQLENMVTCIM